MFGSGLAPAVLFVLGLSTISTLPPIERFEMPLCVIGDMLVRPRVPSMTSKAAVFRRGEKLNVWMQVYNLAVDDKNGKSDASVDFDVVQEGTKKTVLHGTQPADLRAAGQLTLEKTFSVNELEPGIYRLKVHVRDQIAKQGVEPEATFAIE